MIGWINGATIKPFQPAYPGQHCIAPVSGDHAEPCMGAGETPFLCSVERRFEDINNLQELPRLALGQVKTITSTK
jgi:hypothetical protein